MGGGTRARFSSLYAQQGENDAFSAIDLQDGSVVLAAMGVDNDSIPRVDTADATVYLSAGSKVRVNADPRRGTVVVVRTGSAGCALRSDSYTVEAGQYLMVEGTWSRDLPRRVLEGPLDLWAADRLEELDTDTGRSASVQYVDDDYASDVVALDGYGDWEYSNTYSTQVWVPRVNINWTPYSSGSWYYTPIGLTWWSSDPWGWYPYHYGSWYFDASFRHWCWAPSYVYSPAWGWGYSNNYGDGAPSGSTRSTPPGRQHYSNWGCGGCSRRTPRVRALRFIQDGQGGRGGWNFVANKSFGSGNERLPVVSGNRLVSALGDQLAISPKPIVVSGRSGGITQALQDHVRQAPGVIERTKNRDSASLAPVLARQKSLPPATLDALQGRAVVAGRGRLGGPGAEELASRGTIVERSRSVSELLGTRGFEKSPVKAGGNKPTIFDRGRKAPVSIMPSDSSPSEAPLARAPRNDPGTRDVWRGRGQEVGRAEAPDVSSMEKERGRGRPEVQESPRTGKNPDRVAPAPAPGVQQWRERGGAGKQAPPAPVLEAPRQKSGRSVARDDDWRGRPEPRTFAPGREARAPEASWRSRDDSPAKRVIDGSVPGRRWQEDAPRVKQNPPAEWRQRVERPAPAPREYRSAPVDRGYRAPQREYRPEAREYKAPPREREYRRGIPAGAAGVQGAPPQREYRPENRPRRGSTAHLLRNASTDPPPPPRQRRRTPCRVRRLLPLRRATRGRGTAGETKASSEGPNPVFLRDFLFSHRASGRGLFLPAITIRRK